MVGVFVTRNPFKIELHTVIRAAIIGRLINYSLVMKLFTDYFDNQSIASVSSAKM